MIKACNSLVCIYGLFKCYLYLFLILGHDTEPEDLSIRTKVPEKLNDISDLYSFGDESDTSQSIPDSE